MKKEKRLKTKIVYLRVTPDDFKFYSDYAKKKGLTKTKLFDMFLTELKDKDEIGK